MTANSVSDRKWWPLFWSSSAVSGCDVRSRWSRKVALDIVALLDVAAVVIGAFLPVMIYWVFGGMTPHIVLAIQSSMAAAIVLVLLLKSWGMYDVGRVHDLPGNPELLLGALGLAFVAVMGLGVPYAVKETHLWVWYATWGVATYTLLLANRDICKFVLKKMTLAGQFNQRIAVYGAGKIARRVHDRFNDSDLGVSFVGVFDDRAASDRVDLEGLDVAGGLEDLVEASRDGNIDKIVIALPQFADGRMKMITSRLEQLPVSVHIVTHIASDLMEPGATHKVSSVGEVGLLDVKAKALSDWSPFLKRCEDILIGSVAMVFVAVISPFIALAIRLDSPGPILFRQRRRGLNMKEFDVLKFRTMTVSNAQNDVEQATLNDPRVTRVGRFLRRFSLDELPQVINVLRGEMSLVGPRPHAVVHDEEFSSTLELYANRHQVRPGITGLAQVKGWRGETRTLEQLEKRVGFDIDYIKNWSLILDLKILAGTLWTVVVGKNAY